MALCSLLIRRKDRKTGRTFCNLWQTITSIPISILYPVNVYRAEGVLKDGSYVNPGEGLYPEYAYLQMDKTPEMELVYRNEMKPTWEDFGSFCHNMHCTSSHRNRNIADILEEIESTP